MPSFIFREIDSLFQEKPFANLITAHEGFRRAEFREEAKNLAVLKDMIVDSQRWGGHKLDGLGIGDPIAMKTVHGSAVEQREDDAIGTQYFGEPRHQRRHHCRVEIVQEVPCQNAMKMIFRILKRGLEELFGKHCRGSNPPLFSYRREAKVLLLRCQELLPSSQQIIGGKAVALLDEEGHRRLPDGSEIEDAGAWNVAEQPKELLQAIGDTCVPGVARSHRRPGLRHRGARRGRRGGAGAGGASFGRPIHRMLFGVRASGDALQLLGRASCRGGCRRGFTGLSAGSRRLHFATESGAIVDGNSRSEYTAGDAAARAEPDTIGRLQIALNHSLDHDLASLDFGLDASCGADGNASARQADLTVYLAIDKKV